MSAADIYRQKAEELLRPATETTNMAERSRLISEAVHWHATAQEMSGVEEAISELTSLNRDFEGSEAGES